MSKPYWFLHDTLAKRLTRRSKDGDITRVILPRLLLGVNFIALCRGVMNLAWVLLLTLGVLAEKTIPADKALCNLLGIALISFGAFSYIVIFGQHRSCLCQVWR